MTKALAHTYIIAHEYHRQILGALVAVCGFLLVLYAMNVYSVISHTVALESIQKQTTALATAIDGLDSKYLDLSSKASPDTLKEYGFTQGQISAFISRTTSLGSVASRAHEL